MPTWPEHYAVGLLLLRFIVGAVLFAHGAQKVLKWFGGYGLQGTINYFKTALKIPPFIGYIGAFIEFLGAIGVFLGLLTRLSALGLFCVMVVALYTSHRKNGFFMNWGAQADKGEGYEYTLTLVVLTLVIVISGPGPYSLDALL